MKDAENSDLVNLYNEIWNSIGNKADYIPYIEGVEHCYDWAMDEAEEYFKGFYYASSEAPDYLATYTAALVNDYGYTKTGDNVFVNEETGIRIEIETDEYGYVYIRFFEA